MRLRGGYREKVAAVFIAYINGQRKKITSGKCQIHDLEKEMAKRFERARNGQVTGTKLYCGFKNTR